MPPERAVGRGRTARGATLIELIVSIIILGALSGVAGVFILQGVKAWQLFQFRADNGMQARQAIDWMTRELRETDVDGAGAPVIGTADARTITFDHNLPDGTAETLTFSWDGTAGHPVLRNTSTLVPQATGFALAYYNQNDVALASLPLSAIDLSNVRRIVITLSIRNDFVTSYTMNLKGEAYLRGPYN